jgi:hypothetical protein
MFITSKHSGYNRHGEQIAAGLFLILMEPKLDSGRLPRRTDTCSYCGKYELSHEAQLPENEQTAAGILHRAWKHLFTERCEAGERTESNRDAAEIILDAKRRVTGCRYFLPATVSYPIKAIVRHTSLRQCGHFMMGSARVHGARITLSGSYGGDGLTCTVPDAVYTDYGVELPRELVAAWSHGGGWNSAGSEAGEMRKWALENLEELRK